MRDEAHPQPSSSWDLEEQLRLPDGPIDVRSLAAQAGIPLSEDEVEPVAEVVEAMTRLFASLDLGDVPQDTLDPRWR